MQGRNYLVLVAAAVIALITVVLNPAAMAQNLSGAIFTTDMNSSFVNGNVMILKRRFTSTAGRVPMLPAAGRVCRMDTITSRLRIPPGASFFPVTILAYGRCT